MLMASSLISFTMAFFQSPNRATSDSVQYGVSRQRPPLPGVFFSLAADSDYPSRGWTLVRRPRAAMESKFAQIHVSASLASLTIRSRDASVGSPYRCHRGLYFSLLINLSGSLRSVSSHSYSYSNSHSHSHSYSYSNSNSHSYSNSYSHSHSYSHSNSLLILPDSL